MGIFQSKEDIISIESLEQRREQEQQRIREYKLRHFGVLVPPMFGISNSNTTIQTTPSITLNTNINNSGITSATRGQHHEPIIGYVDYLRNNDISTRILQSYYSTGLTISSNNIHYNMNHNDIPSSKTTVQVGLYDTSSSPYMMNQQQPQPQQRNFSSGNTTDTEDGDDLQSTSSSINTPIINYKQLQQKHNVDPTTLSLQNVVGQVIVERQFYTSATTPTKYYNGRNYYKYASIQLYANPTNYITPFTAIHASYHPIPSISIFGTYIPQQQHTKMNDPFTKTTTINGYIGAQFDHSIPLSSSTSSSPPSSPPSPLAPPSVSCNDEVDWSNNHQLQYQNNNNNNNNNSINNNNDDENHVLRYKIGAFVPINWNHILDYSHSLIQKSINNTSSVPSYNKSNHPSYISYKDNYSNHPLRPDSIHGCASVSVLGATAALQGSIPLNTHTNNGYTTSSYFTTNLNDNDDNESSSHQSPIRLTIQQQNQFGISNNSNSNCNNIISSNSSLSVSQILTFQRYQFNPIEDRAPYIHNTLAWTIQMESISSNSLSSFSHSKALSSSSLAEDSGEHNNNNHTNTGTEPNQRMNRISLGAIWQINRNLAIKAIIYPKQQQQQQQQQQQSTTDNSTNNLGITTAILLKRWYYPRITCSIIHQWDNGGNTDSPMFIPRFAGIGIDIETGNDNDDASKCWLTSRSTMHNNNSKHQNYSNDDHASSSSSSSPTIAVLPKELYKSKLKRQ